MENGISPGGNGDRHDPSSPPDRRKTVSGAIPQLDHEDDDRVTPIETMRFPWSSPSAPTTPLSPTTSPPAAIKSPGHKRTFSGNLLSRFGFGRNGSEEGRPPSRSERPSSRDKDIPSPTKSLFSRKSTDDDAPLTSPTSPNGEKQSALATALRQSKTRKRKGSLRKTALLGGRRIVTEGRDRKGSLALLQRTPSTKQIKILAQQQNAQQQEEAVVDLSASTDGEATTTPAANGGSEPSLRRQFSYEKPTEPSNSDSDWSAVSAARLSLLAEQKDQAAAEPVPQPQASKFLGSPLDTGTLTSNASTTDDDDLPSFQTRSKLLQPQQTQSSATTSSLNAPLSSAVTSHYQSQSCYPSQTSLTRRHSNKALNAPTPSPPPEIHSYIETEWWGWIILTFTWLAFTVGMGSCLDLWSWAWDVGETPYAPPELEDDPTLPIVGYYPALTVLTGVVAWVWITVAWVGMKYFRHAKIEV